MASDLALLWNELLVSLEGRLNKPVYEALLSSAKPLSLLDGRLSIAVPNEVVQEWLTEHCGQLLPRVQQSSSEIERLEFVVGPKELFETPPLEKTGYQLSFPAAPPIETRPLALNPRYTFDSFVVGPHNRFAHAAALAVAEAPAKAYNPLFIYGRVGLGKTHLMQAIGHHVVRAFPRVKVIYVTSEGFTNEFIGSIRDGRIIGDFRNKYRSIDILLVDDVQFLAGKERSQEEFFHTFNTLYESARQLVLSSDRPPKEIPSFEERLRSRLEWGLTADIQPPDFETRIAILKKKAEVSELTVPDEVLSLIATKITSNIRELEGALIRTVAYASLTSSEITLNMTEGVLKDIASPQKEVSALSIDVIKKVVAEYYSVKIDDMDAKIRSKEIAVARQVAMYFARHLLETSYPKIGEEFGGRDHSTVMYACERVGEGIKSDPEIAEAAGALNKILKNYKP